MRPALAVFALLLSFLVVAGARATDTIGDCRLGAYRLADGSMVDIGPSIDDPVRWRRFDGTTGALHPHPDGVWTSTLGWTGRPDGKTVTFSDCQSGEIVFDGVRGRRIAFDVTDTAFAGDGVKLVGRLVLPRGDGPVPIVVLVHGSEDTSALAFYALQRLLPAAGVGVFVYDKRGTGASGGHYTQDFNLLANDAVAAVGEARRLAGRRAGRIGFQGSSEGGWVAPLAASRTHVDFLIVAYGLAVSVLDEDREEMALEMKLKGHGASEIADALQIADAAGAIMTSKFTSGFDRFDAVRARYRDAPWYKDVHGNFTWALMPYDQAELRARAPQFLFGTPMTYDPMPVLRRLKTPQLWIMGTDDLQAPMAETRRRLARLQARGAPITYAVFPHAEHGIYEFEINAKGERDDTRNADGYFAMMRDFALRGRLRGPYGQSRITRPPPLAAHARPNMTTGR